MVLMVVMEAQRTTKIRILTLDQIYEIQSLNDRNESDWVNVRENPNHEKVIQLKALDRKLKLQDGE